MDMMISTVWKHAVVLINVLFDIQPYIYILLTKHIINENKINFYD